MRVFLLLFALLLPGLAAAQSVKFDTLSNRPVGPGVRHLYIEAPSVPWTINVLEVDLTNPYIEIETAKSNNLLEGGHERTSSMARRHDAPGHRVVGGVNGDYYSGAARPISLQVLDGQILQPPASGRPALGFDANDRPWMAMTALKAKLLLRDTTVTINSVNASRGTNDLVLYNSFKGSTTGTNAFGTEVRVRVLGGWQANDTLRLVVEAVEGGKGAMAIPAGQAVLSGHGTASAVLKDRLAVGDTVRAYLGLQPGLPRTKEAIGSGPYIVQNGKVDVGPRGDGVQVHPRTAAGFSKDSTKLYLVTVDGRQATSAGITLANLADFMVRIGVHTAMNFDGGGSTTMVVRDQIANSPSDGGGERTVSNALLVISSAPEGELSRLFVTPERAKIFRGGKTTFTVYGTDAHFRPMPITASNLSFRVDPRLGSIDEKGVFTAGTERDSGYVYVRYGNLVDSAYVSIKTVARFDLAPAQVLTDTSRVVAFTTRAFDQDGLEQEVPTTSYTWRVSNPAVGTVDPAGRFQGRAPGVTDVVADYRGLKQTAAVTVHVARGTALLSSLDDPGSWKLVGANVDPAGTRLAATSDTLVEGSAALRLDYRFVYDPAVLHEVYLETDLPIAGVPDSLYLDARSDGRRHRVFFDVEDALGNPFQLYAAAFANSTDAFAPQPSAFARAQAKSGAQTMVHPLRLKRILVRLDSEKSAGATFSGRLYLDHLRVTYPTKATAREDGGAVPGQARLLPNYPNPFSGATTLAYDLDRPARVRLTVYDVLGRTVTTLVDGVQPAGRHAVPFEAGALPAGLYFYRLEAGSTLRTGRMLQVH